MQQRLPLRHHLRSACGPRRGQALLKHPSHGHRLRPVTTGPRRQQDRAPPSTSQWPPLRGSTPLPPPLPSRSCQPFLHRTQRLPSTMIHFRRRSEVLEALRHSTATRRPWATRPPSTYSSRPRPCNITAICIPLQTTTNSKQHYSMDSSPHQRAISTPPPASPSRRTRPTARLLTGLSSHHALSRFMALPVSLLRSKPTLRSSESPTRRRTIRCHGRTRRRRPPPRRVPPFKRRPYAPRTSSRRGMTATCATWLPPPGHR